MARSVSYGMGQYRYTKDYSYLLEKTIDEGSIQDYHYKDYQDIQVILPTISTGTNTETPFIQYGQTYYMRLTVPQHNQYDTTLKLKLCPVSTKTGNMDTDRYQEIKQLFVPKTLEDDDTFSDVILFEVPEGADSSRPLKAHLWDENHNYELYNKTNTNIDKFSTHTPGEVYYEKNTETNSNVYRYYTESQSYLMDDHYYIGQLPQTWKMKDISSSTITFDFVFSPKYNLTGGYPYLWIEIDRTDAYQRTIQYVEGDTYYGTKLDKNDIKIELYAVSNLLESIGAGGSQIQSGTNSLSHIAVWGHPGQILAVNGEEIRIGQSGFYELNDFTINQLGVVVYDKDTDRFTIDYEYKILNG